MINTSKLKLLNFKNPNYSKFFGKKLIHADNLMYKITHDGGHYIAQLCVSQKPQKRALKNTEKSTKLLNAHFDSFYYEGLQSGLKRKELAEHIKTKLLDHFPDFANIDEYIEQRTKNNIINIHKRIKRFKQKAYLHRWNYFVTFTYDDKLHTEETFKKKIRKSLSNLHTRRGWKYIGVFERSKNGRLHFHGIFNIPSGEMIGKLETKTDYDTDKKQMQTYFENTFFKNNYGRNDFKEVNVMNNFTINYILKYIAKTYERLVFSRGIPTAIYKRLDCDDLATCLKCFVLKFVLWDNVIDYEKDILRYKPKQTNIIDLLCNRAC